MRMDDRSMARVVLLCLMALSVNAVLIQTIVTDESPLKNFVRVSVLLLATYAMFLYNSHIPIWMVLTICLSVSLMLLMRNPDQLSYIFVLLLVPALWSISERRLEKLMVLSSLASLALVFALLGFGITQNEVLQPRDRMTFGTQGVPFFYNLVYGVATLLVLYSQKYRLRNRRPVLLGSIAGTTSLFFATDARGGYLSFLSFLILLLLVPRLRESSLFRLTVAGLPGVFLVVAFLLASQGSNFELNQLLSYRPMFYSLFIDNITFSDVLFGTTVKQFDRATTIVDNSYLHLLVGGGLAICLIYLVVFARAVRNLFQRERHVEIAFLVATCVYFNSESIMLRIENVFVIYSWYLILRYSQDHPESNAVSSEARAGRPSERASAGTPVTSLSNG